MRELRFLLRLPFFLIAYVFLWFLQLGFWKVFLFENNRLEMDEKRNRLEDWLWGVPAEFRFRNNRDRFG